MLYIGNAQEKARVLRTERRRRPSTGATYAWLVDSTAMVNHFYFYVVDDDFGPFFLKFCSYFPYNAKLCINGHEYLKRQLAKRGIAFEPLDNGILRCSDPVAMQRLADGLTADKIDALLRKWLALLPHPFRTPQPRRHHRSRDDLVDCMAALPGQGHLDSSKHRCTGQISTSSSHQPSARTARYRRPSSSRSTRGADERASPSLPRREAS